MYVCGGASSRPARQKVTILHIYTHIYTYIGVYIRCIYSYTRILFTLYSIHCTVLTYHISHISYLVSHITYHTSTHTTHPHILPHIHTYTSKGSSKYLSYCLFIFSIPLSYCLFILISYAICHMPYSHTLLLSSHTKGS
jgi:hypothetical protein